MKLKIIGIIISFILAFPLHFLYDKFPNVITSIISPVNESIAEHMKILFGCILLSGIIQKIIVLSKKLKYNNTCFSNVLSALLSIPIFLFLYLPIYYSIGENIIITIIIMFITIVIAEIISYQIMKKDDLKLEKISILLVIIVYITFSILTYFPPKKELFLDPISLNYGIKK